MKKPIIIQILYLVRDEGPISPRKIIETLKITRGSAYPLISLLRTLGLIQYWKEESIYVISEYGKQCPALKGEGGKHG